MYFSVGGVLKPLMGNITALKVEMTAGNVNDFLFYDKTLILTIHGNSFFLCGKVF